MRSLAHDNPEPFEQGNETAVAHRARPPRAKHRLLVLPDDTIEPLLAAMNTAKRSLNVRMFVFEDKQLLDAVVHARKRGLTVRVMLNRQRRDGTSENDFAAAALADAGIEVRGSHPRFELTHEKSLVVDDRLGFVQTMNWNASRHRSTRDYAVVTEEPLEVDEMIAGFNADWERRVFTPRMDSSLIWCPDNGRTRLAAFIDRSCHSLWVQNDRYQDKVVVERLARAALRGVRVHVLTPPPHQLKPDKLAEGIAGLRILQDVGVSVHVARHLRLHAKMMVADHRSAIVGSINLAPGSFNHRRELAIETSDRPTVERLEATARSDWSYSKRIDLSSAVLGRDLAAHASVDVGALSL